MDKNSIPKKGARNKVTCLRGNFKSSSEREATVQWYKELVARLIQRSESAEKARQQIVKLIESKGILVRKLKEKDEEIQRLNEKISLLLHELSVSKNLHSRALDEIEMLKKNLLKKSSSVKQEETAKKNEVIEQEKSLCDDVQKELAKSQSSLTKENLEVKSLGTPLKWQTMQYADPHYFEMLQKRNHLRKEFEKKNIIKKNKEMQLNRQNVLLESFRNMLECKPCYPLEEPTDQMMEFYKTIQLHKKKKEQQLKANVMT